MHQNEYKHAYIWSSDSRLSYDWSGSSWDSLWHFYQQHEQDLFFPFKQVVRKNKAHIRLLGVIFARSPFLTQLMVHVQIGSCIVFYFKAYCPRSLIPNFELNCSGGFHTNRVKLIIGTIAIFSSISSKFIVHFSVVKFTRGILRKIRSFFWYQNFRKFEKKMKHSNRQSGSFKWPATQNLHTITAFVLHRSSCAIFTE